MESVEEWGEGEGGCEDEWRMVPLHCTERCQLSAGSRPVQYLLGGEGGRE